MDVTSGLVRTAINCFSSSLHHLLLHNICRIPCSSRRPACRCRFPLSFSLSHWCSPAPPDLTYSEKQPQGDRYLQPPCPQHPRQPPTMRSPTRCRDSQRKKSWPRPQDAGGEAGTMAATHWHTSIPVKPASCFQPSAVLPNPVCTSLRPSSSATRFLLDSLVSP